MKRARGRGPTDTWLLRLAAGLLLLSCNNGGPAQKGRHQAADAKKKFRALIAAGNLLYAEKGGYASFTSAMRYFDSAQILADQSGDTAMLADALFARGRVYDAWNREPLETVRYFDSAARLMAHLPGYRSKYFYLRQLTAHAYEKAQDTPGTVNALRALYSETLPLPAAERDELNFLPEGALIATGVAAYPLADSILTQLVRRAAIRNDPESYPFLDHYFITQATLDAYWRRPVHSYYLDTLQRVYDTTRGLSNRFDYYSRTLARLNGAFGRWAEAYRYSAEADAQRDSINTVKGVVAMQRALSQGEVDAERRKADYEAGMARAGHRTLWMVCGLLAVISALSIYLFRRNKMYAAQSLRLSAANEALDKQVGQVELLNKEIQHRVKNNLHMIYSLLQMQERKTENEETIDALQAARLRVESIAALHNQLLAGKGNLDFAEYIRSLISSVVNCLSDEKKVVTHISTAPISIPVNSYFALSLVLNEWVTNSIKYAATPSNLIEIKVDISNRAGDVCIEYSDSGEPSLATKPKGNGNGLGSQIVSLLSRQMNAELTNIGGNPFHYQLCIPHGAQD